LSYLDWLLTFGIIASATYGPDYTYQSDYDGLYYASQDAADRAERAAEEAEESAQRAEGAAQN
jgi:hypothetical protein